MARFKIENSKFKRGLCLKRHVCKQPKKEPGDGALFPMGDLAMGLFLMCNFSKLAKRKGMLSL